MPRLAPVGPCWRGKLAMGPPLLLARTRCQITRPQMLLLTPLLLAMAASWGHSLGQPRLLPWSLWHPPLSIHLVGPPPWLLEAQALLPWLAGPQ